MTEHDPSTELPHEPDAPADVAITPTRRRRGASRPAGPPVALFSASEVVPAPVGRLAESVEEPIVVVVEDPALAADASAQDPAETPAVASEDVEAPPARKRAPRRRVAAPVLFQPPVAAPVVAQPVAALVEVAVPAADEPETDDAPADEADAEVDTDAESESDAESDSGAPRRRRRRGGRGRRRPAGSRADDDADDADGDGDDDSASDARSQAAEARQVDGATKGAGDDASDDAADQASDDDTSGQASDDDASDDDSGEPRSSGGASSRRRRRRRRRSSDSTEASVAQDAGGDDPPNTVVRVRAPRTTEPRDEVVGIKGSTRIEAKRQRRREGRDAGRRRPPILSEAEFLARREAVDRMLAVRQHGDRTQIAVLEDGVLVEHYVSRNSQRSLIGNVYLGKVQNVLPSMEAAFVDIGKGRNAVLYAGEVDWAGLGLSGGGPKRIENVLTSGQTVLVQVTKDPVGHKGARLTSNVSLPGRYLVYVPGGSTSGISRKLSDTERARLKRILKDVVPDDAGVIVRTAAEGASEEELILDVARLTAQWEDIERVSRKGSAPALLSSEPDLTIKVVRDLFNEDFGSLVVSGDEAWETIAPYVEQVAPHLQERVSRWEGAGDVFTAYRVDEQLAKALDRKVHLPSGGSLVIDRTEAMTVVDVNTGRYTGSGGNLEETVTRNNLEAAEEIVRQLRLRDIGGIIVVDFIDMVLESNRDLVVRRLVECLGRDRTKHQVAEVTSLGLVQMTRKRIGTGLLEAFSEVCEHCQGRGVLVHDEPVEDEPSGTPREAPSSTTARRRRGRGGGTPGDDADAAADADVADSSGPVHPARPVPAPGLVPGIAVPSTEDLQVSDEPVVSDATYELTNESEPAAEPAAEGDPV